jgi:hypothetical protein
MIKILLRSGNEKDIDYHFLDFYDPDGYYFDVDGFDEFGGYYDKKGYYHPGKANAHEFKDLLEYDDEEEDELILQFERGHRHSEDVKDELQEILYNEFTQKEKDLYVENEEEKDLDDFSHQE